jgi:cell division inhibitor SepF
MSALRKAGVWLGLIEDDEDGAYGYDDRGYDEDYPDDEFVDAGTVVRNRVADRLAGQRAERNERAGVSDRTYIDDEDDVRHDHDRVSTGRMTSEASETGRLSTVRPISRPNSALDPSGPRMRANEAVAYPTQDNLALVPEARTVEVRPEVKVAPRPVDERRYQITTLHPMTFNDARTIGENFRDGVPVILNLTEMGEADAKRLVDFAAGLAFGLRGTMERVTNRVFLLSPANIQVTAEDKAKIAEGGFFHQ